MHLSLCLFLSHTLTLSLSRSLFLSLARARALSLVLSLSLSLSLQDAAQLQRALKRGVEATQVVWYRFSLKWEQLQTFQELLPENQGHNLAVSVLCVPSLFDSGEGSALSLSPHPSLSRPIPHSLQQGAYCA